jgi:hypothetical protein
VAGLREDGIVAPLVWDEPMRGEIFKAYVEQMLAPALSPGDVVVRDNLAAHKVAGGEEAIRAVGASLLYLPNPRSTSIPPSPRRGQVFVSSGVQFSVRPTTTSGTAGMSPSKSNLL